jgi:hypothetical protein
MKMRTLVERFIALYLVPSAIFAQGPARKQLRSNNRKHKRVARVRQHPNEANLGVA